MRRKRLVYVELKSGHQDNGPAWIGRAKFSASGRTLYFNGKALKRSGGQGIAGNHYDIETGDEYWVSGVKRDGSDRHWAGSGVIKIDASVVNEYLTLRSIKTLNPMRFKVCTDIIETDIARFHKIENERL